MSEKEIRVLYVQPGKYPEERTIPNTYEARQKLVGEDLTVCHPWRDNACIISNDAAQDLDLPPNRLYGYDGCIAGSFIVCGDSDDGLISLTDEQMAYYEMFYTHEINKRGVSGNTVLHYHANIRKALSDAVKLKLIPYNPAAEVERPKKDNFVASYYSADELMEVLPIFANTKMELPVMLAAFYGLRRSEVIGLQWSAIDFERKIVTISRTFERINVDGKMVDVSKCRTKNKSSFRSLPLIPAVEQALLKAQKRQRQQMKLCGNSYCKEYKDYICVDDMGHLVTPDYVTRVFREMLLKNGFRPIRYHDLRHSCASLLIKNKVTMKEVQMWLGHSSFSTTANIYAHIDVDSKMEAANMIASKINLGELPEKKKSPKRKIA